MAQVTRAARVKPAVRPTLRGVSHQYACAFAVGAGIVLVVLADGALARVGAAAFAFAVALMFGVSAVDHRVTWRPRPRRWHWGRADDAASYHADRRHRIRCSRSSLSTALVDQRADVVWPAARQR